MLHDRFTNNTCGLTHERHSKPKLRTAEVLARYESEGPRPILSRLTKVPTFLVLLQISEWLIPELSTNSANATLASHLGQTETGRDGILARKRPVKPFPFNHAYKIRKPCALDQS